jgi:hypothetical protein
MPVRPLKPRKPDPSEQVLMQRLIDEWKSVNTGATQPIILEEGFNTSQPRHVYVIWDDWNNLDRVRRSEIIMDALEQVYGSDEALNVTIAMGLTPAEANLLGIQWEE